VNTKRRSAFPWAQPFFGLTPSDKEIYLEEAFLLMYYGGFTYTEAYKLPITYRKWFIDRINKEFKKATEAGEDPQTRASHQGDSMSRMLSGKSRGEMPSRIRRFT
jgi:hypothetical protein